MCVSIPRSPDSVGSLRLSNIWSNTDSHIQTQISPTVSCLGLHHSKGGLAPINNNMLKQIHNNQKNPMSNITLVPSPRYLKEGRLCYTGWVCYLCLDFLFSVLWFYLILFYAVISGVKGGIVSGCLDVQLTGKVIGIIETCLLNNFLSLKVYTLSDWRGNNLRGRSSK